MYLDLFFEEDPTTELVDGEKVDESKRLIGNDDDQIYAVTRVANGADEFFHCHLTVAQYKSLSAEDPKLTKSASKLAKKVLKSAVKLDGSTDDCPVHCFGSHIVDIESKKIYRPDKKNADLSDEDVALILADSVEVEPVK